jgi:predicted nuclease of predicted toxin-antitoxin system
MRLLADESLDFVILRTLRAANHDVLAVSEISPRTDDVDVINLAVREARILLTEDKDFGQLVYAHGQKTLGVIFLRYPISAREQISEDVLKLVEQYDHSLYGCFVVVQPGRIRIGRAP